jgi:hypothetical protein
MTNTIYPAKFKRTDAKFKRTDGSTAALRSG